MPISPGTRLGPYEIVAPLGAGGMGEVYRALDTRLGREVAVKVLPPHLASLPEVRARFEREARTISQLNFPHICTLYDVGHEAGVDYLVMELVDGETLAHRLARGALPMAEVLTYGRQVAEALERAHRAGVVHRDLKPGNIMLTKTGAKLMDFGLARPHGMNSAASGMTQSPTVGAPLTAEGTIVGTFQYMAPEQLEGKEADARADLWALGCVLYEMATGQRAFAGDSQASLIGSIMRDHPVPVVERAPAAPAPLGRLVAALLAKSPDDRVQSAHDVKLQLQWAAEPALGTAAAVPAGAAPAKGRGGARLAWAVAAVAIVAALGTAAWALLGREKGIGPITAALAPPSGAAFSTSAPLPLAISPDGSHVAFVAHLGNGPDRLWVRPIGAAEARELPGTERATLPFFSPDGRTIAFFDGVQLKRVGVDGGPVTKITDCNDSRGGTWGRDNRILYAPRGFGGLVVVDADGGTPREVTQLDTTLQEVTHRYPHFLPDGEHFLYLARRGGAGRGESPAIYLAKLGKPGRTKVLEVASNVAYASGHLLYVEQGNLVARRFDPASGRLSGPARPISSRVTMDERFSRAPFVVSRNGVLAYMTGEAQLMSRLVWMDRSGARLREVGGPGAYTFGGLVKLDPGGRRAAVAMFSTERGLSDVWIVDTESGNRQRVSADNEDHYAYAWGPGARSLFMNTLLGNGTSQVIERSLDGSGAVRTLVSSRDYLYPGTVGPDGRWLTIDTGDMTQNSDAVALHLQNGERVLIAGGKAHQINARFSPDGRFVVYESDESGRPEIYVTPFPPTGAKFQASTKGGAQAVWRSDGAELFYLDPENYVTAVPIRWNAGVPEFGAAARLFQVYGGYGPVLRYDAAPGGQRFLVSEDIAELNSAPVVLVTDWVKTLGK